MPRNQFLLVSCFLFGLALSIVQAGRVSCAQMSCGTGSCCNDNNLGAVCYNPTQYDCVTDNTNNLALCTKGAGACNGVCFDAKSYHCSGNGIAQGAVTSQAVKTSAVLTSAVKTSAVPTSAVKTSAALTSAVKTSAVLTSTTAQASSVTPSTTSLYCKAGTCGSGFSCCGKNQCYLSNSFSCIYDETIASEHLCPFGFYSCKGGCYDPNVYSCQTSGLVLGKETKTSTTNIAPQTSKAGTSTTASVPKSSVIVNPVPVPSVPSNTVVTQTADLRIINNCKYTLWIEGRYGGKGAPIPGHSNTSTRALPGGYVDYVVPPTGLSGTRFWAKYGCDSAGRNCKIGDQMQYYPDGGCPTQGCTAPIDSLFEATFGCKPGSSCATSSPTTWFDTSQVDGYTIPYKVTLNGAKNKCDCSSSGCGLDYIDATNLDLSKCPSGENLSANNAVTSAKVGGITQSLTSVDLRLIDKSTNSILGCLSPCKKMSWQWGLNEGTSPTLYYCCPTPNPANCQIGNGCISSEGCRNGPVINTQYVKSIHKMAPGIYTYAYDDGVGLHACPAGTVTYTMEFCPAGSATYPHPL